MISIQPIQVEVWNIAFPQVSPAVIHITPYGLNKHYSTRNSHYSLFLEISFVE
ncbi:MAG: hypothetical protein LBT04_07170 [Prevotellaceae bacterium]|nr:hypothetical protein [Prevotellaceae bacterium]